MEKGSGYLIIDVAGVGYQVLMASSTLEELALNKPVTLRTRLIVREDSWTLYGFTSVSQMNIFDELLKVTGVGPKSALAIITELTPQEILQALNDADEKAFTRAPGIGPKTSRLIIATLSGRLSTVLTETDGALPEEENQRDQLNIALQGLGWTPKESAAITERLAKQGIFEQSYELGHIIKLALAGSKS